MIERIHGARVHHNVIQYNRRQEYNGACLPVQDITAMGLAA
jgi:hypothetical protein